MTTDTRAARSGQSPTAVAIRSAAVELFYERGFEATSQRQLADAVGIQVASLYNHIRSKEDLLADIMKAAMSQLIESTRAAVDSAATPEEQLRAFMVEGITFHAEYQKLALVGNTELRSLTNHNHAEVVALRDEYEELLKSILRACVKRGTVDVENVTIAAFAGVAICVHVASWYRSEGSLPLEGVIRELLASYAPTAEGSPRRTTTRRPPSKAPAGKTSVTTANRPKK
jgi:AcrR family transcriptional regulator